MILTHFKTTEFKTAAGDYKKIEFGELKGLCFLSFDYVNDKLEAVNVGTMLSKKKITSWLLLAIKDGKIALSSFKDMNTGEYYQHYEFVSNKITKEMFGEISLNNTLIILKFAEDLISALPTLKVAPKLQYTITDLKQILL